MDYPVIHQNYNFTVQNPYGDTTRTKQITKSKLPVENRYMTTQEVLKMFSITPPTLARWQRIKGFPKPRIVSVPNRFLKSDIEDWENGIVQGRIIDIN